MLPPARIALVAAAACVTACSSATDPGGLGVATGVTATEAQTLPALLLAEINHVPWVQTGASDAEDTFSFGGPCVLGGSMAGTASSPAGTFDGATQSGTVTYVVTAYPQGCVVRIGARQFVTTGAPRLEITYTATVAAGDPTAITTTFGGAFVWDGGNCQLNYTVTTRIAGATRTTRTVGTVCGQQLDVTATV